jgi:hypothetical protein
MTTLQEVRKTLKATRKTVKDVATLVQANAMKERIPTDASMRAQAKVSQFFIVTI